MAAVIRLANADDRADAYYVCLKTGDHGQDAESLFRDDPDALGRIYVGPYLAFEPDLSLVLQDEAGVCGYALGALDSHRFYAQYEREWRQNLRATFPRPQGDPKQWTRTQHVHQAYHDPDYFCPEPYALYPSHLHIDLLPRVQGRGYGRRLIEALLGRLRQRGSPGVHLNVSPLNERAIGFYSRLGFHELARLVSADNGCVCMGKTI